MNRGEKRRLFSQLKREARKHSRGYEGVADEAGLRGRDRAVFLMLMRSAEEDGSAAAVAALDRGPDPGMRASLTDDQRRFLDVLAERLIDSDDGTAPGVAWICSRLDWAPERAETVAAELRELGMVS